MVTSGSILRISSVRLSAPKAGGSGCVASVGSDGLALQTDENKAEEPITRNQTQAEESLPSETCSMDEKKKRGSNDLLRQKVVGVR